MKEIFQTIAAQVDGEPCCDWVGPGGAGHFVKMVHNGIEYGDMQRMFFLSLSERYTVSMRLVVLLFPLNAAAAFNIYRMSASFVFYGISMPLKASRVA